ncbi:MAG: TusE/DsrC/DsvC family sulfur relay protein [Candidatus Paceibacterota bacterium]|jgi:tRNA 2-thiouridine synthesizing protein E
MEHSILFKGKEIALDEDGHLRDPNDWSTDLAEYFASNDEIKLAENHWEIINLVREYYKHYQISPGIKMLLRHVYEVLGPEKGNAKYMYDLFPNGPSKMTCLYAGVPRYRG